MLTKKKPSKKVTKKTVKKVVNKVATKSRPVKNISPTEVVVRFDTTPSVPSISDLSEPMKDGKKMTLPATWLSEKQLLYITQRTPKQFVRSRKGRGKQSFDYVDGAYIRKVLNFIFAWNWDFFIDDKGIVGDHIWVQGRLVVRGTKTGEVITKTQFGRAEVKYMKDKPHKPENILDYGNDLKSAATDAMKKCASELGIASDVYGKVEYKEESGKDALEAPQDTHYEEPTIRLGEPAPKQLKRMRCIGPDGDGCLGGDGQMSDAEESYSMRMYGKPLCRKCQPEATPKRKR